MLGPYNMVLDGYRAFDVLANHPRIDPARIALMGFSRCGHVDALFQQKRFQQMWNPRAVFAAYIPLYAACTTTFIGDTDVSAAPIRQFHGAADDYAPVAPCRPYFERLRAAGRDVQLRSTPTRIIAMTIRSATRCHRCQGRANPARMQAQGRAAWHDHQCRIRSAVHLEGPLPADRSSHRLQRSGGECDTKAVKEFVRTVFKLK